MVYLTTLTAEYIEQSIARSKQNETFQIRREASSCLLLTKREVCVFETSQIANILTRSKEKERRNWKVKVTISRRLGQLRYKK
jgi:hypothetical protein